MTLSRNAWTGKRKRASLLPAVIALVLLGATTVNAGDTWPFTGESAHGANQPSVHGYTSSQIANWTPQTDPDSALLRSRVPLQTRIAPFTATQANQTLNPSVQMGTIAGDYGNAFIENAPYTNKFAQYHFNFWQYTDYYSYWHGTATAYTPPSYYDSLAQSNWQEKWFEFGMLNIPNPTYTDAAHKNGVLSLAGIFFSNNDRGQQTYKQMLVKNASGQFTVALKLIEMAQYYGFDGFFINQEELSPDIAVADIPNYIAFMKVLQDAGLYVQWDDSVNTSTGANTFARTFNANNISFLYNGGKQVSNSFFFDYGMTGTQITNAINYLNSFNTTNGTSYNILKNGFAGIEAGANRWSTTNSSQLSSKLSGGVPRVSLSTLGADFVHSGLDEDMGLSYPVSHRSENKYQWMTTLREQLWWSGPNVNPKNTTPSSTNTVTDVYADNRNWPGVASVIAERSVIGGNNFSTSFNTGHGLSYYVNGAVSNTAEWSNMSLQDIPVTWEWWQDTTGNRLAVDFDYGPSYDLTGTTRFSYQQIGGYKGGSSLVVKGNLNAENFLRLYKTDLSVNANSKVSVTYNKPSNNDTSTMYIGLVTTANPTTVVKIAVPGSGNKTTGWTTAELNLSAYAGQKIAALGLVYNPGSAAVANYQMNVGQLRVYDGSAVSPAAPTGLAIASAYPGTGEMVLNWDMNTNYAQVKQYNVYVNDIFMGGKYDSMFYIKKLPAQSGTIKVVPVGADGSEGTAATLAYNLNNAVSNLSASSQSNGDLTVSWTNPAGVAGPVKVTVKSLNQITTPAAVSAQTTVAQGTTSATFNNMPVNGDDYEVTVAIGSNLPVSKSGNFIDVVCAPYAESWSWSGNTLNLPMPTTRDWRYLYVYENGTPRSFDTTYSSGSKPRIIRGRTTKASLSFTSAATSVYVVMEDYAGNLSAPLTLR
ncbi:hypothetical protein A3849_12335 [Paenibacillus sp. P46E]|nr:hypothetical protein A3849_12335 [Paenibacillus sp. P46E]